MLSNEKISTYNFSRNFLEETCWKELVNINDRSKKGPG